jgi:UDP-2,4-diacetamido-2,4,6-trideoxy-beta-L-altropyranose hydrolase
MSINNNGSSYGSLVIRADASAKIGTGHVMRSLALGQAWQELGGGVTFLTAPEASGIEERLKSEDMNVEHLSSHPGSCGDAHETIHLAKDSGATWLVVDGYHFDSEYQRIIKDSGLKLLFIDDNGHAYHYYADFVLNQNLHAHERFYPSIEPYTRLLLGTRYVLLRKEFLKWLRWKREIPEVARKVLVTLGGSDPNNVTLKVINALKKIEVPDLDVKIVVATSNPYTETLQNASLSAPCSMRILRNVNDMPDLMAWADLAVSAGGSTCWEMAFMGFPSLILILAENQRPVAGSLDTMGVARNLGWHENLSYDRIAQALSSLLADSETRTEMTRRGQALIDGEGVNKVLMYLRDEGIGLREACEDDCRLLWKWSNDPDVRAASFSSEPIPWEEHAEWFQARVNDPNCIFYIAIDSEGIPIGQVRYEIEDKEAVISVSIDRKIFGKGYGSTIIQFGSRRLFGMTDANTIHAYIKHGNERSGLSFKKAGFKDVGRTVIRGHQAVHLIFQKGDQDARAY